MKLAAILSFSFFQLLAPLPMALAQESIYRCGNEYTNNAADAKARGCKPLQGGNVTVVQGARPAAPAASGPARAGVAATASPPGAPRVDVNEQRNRDAGARAILEAELKRIEARQAALLREYNNGEPEKTGIEGRNYQRYLDRVAELKASIARNEEDMSGIKRELVRLPPAR